MLVKYKPIKRGEGVGERAQQAKALAAKPKDPSSILGTHTVKHRFMSLCPPRVHVAYVLHTLAIFFFSMG